MADSTEVSMEAIGQDRQNAASDAFQTIDVDSGR